MTGKREKKRLVIIPSFNEEEKIGGVIKRIREIDEKMYILVIDDGSSDNTSSESRKAGARVIRLASNMGYGVAVQTGYKYALEKGYDYVVHLDSDGQHDPVYLPKMFAASMSSDADMVIGSRFIEQISAAEKKKVNYKVSTARKLGIRVFAFLASKFIGLRITDPTSGYRALNKRVISFLVNDFFPYDYPDADVIILLHRAGFKIKEVPMVMFDRTSGTSMYTGLKPLYYIFKMFLSVLMTLLRKTPHLQ